MNEMEAQLKSIIKRAKAGDKMAMKSLRNIIARAIEYMPEDAILDIAATMHVSTIRGQLEMN